LFEVGQVPLAYLCGYTYVPSLFGLTWAGFLPTVPLSWLQSCTIKNGLQPKCTPAVYSIGRVDSFAWLPRWSGVITNTPRIAFLAWRKSGQWLTLKVSDCPACVVGWLDG
jgi:hypothetical protein